MGARFTILSVLLLVVCLPAPGDDTDLESLLQSVDEVLAPAPVKEPEKNPTTPPAPRPLRSPRPNKHRHTPPSGSRPTADSSAAPAEKRGGTAPSKELEALLQFSELPIEAEQERSYSSFSLTSGFSYLLGGLRLYKEDDTFLLADSQSLPGVAFQFTPAWELARFSTFAESRLLLISGISAGFFGGNAEVGRSGVINQKRSYPYFHIPLALEVGLRAQWSRAAFDVSYGIGIGVISQRGDGQTDTVTGIHADDSLNFALSWRAFDSLGLYLKTQLGGLDILRRSDGYAANAILVGIRSFSSDSL